jgi:hypothetical protein
MILEVPPVLVRKLVTVALKSEVSTQSGCPPQAFVGLCADAHTCDERIRMKNRKELTAGGHRHGASKVFPC